MVAVLWHMNRQCCSNAFSSTRHTASNGFLPNTSPWKANLWFNKNITWENTQESSKLFRTEPYVANNCKKTQKDQQEKLLLLVVIHTHDTDLIFFQCSTNKKSWLFQHSFSAAMSYVVVSLVCCFVLVILKTSCFSTTTATTATHWLLQTACNLFQYIVSFAEWLCSLQSTAQGSLISIHFYVTHWVSTHK